MVTPEGGCSPYRGYSKLRTRTALGPYCSPYRGYSKLRTHPAIGPYGRSIPRSIGPAYGQCVSLKSSNPCTTASMSFGVPPPKSEPEFSSYPHYRGYSQSSTRTAPRVVLCS